jgi:hypothetical protein
MDGDRKQDGALQGCKSVRIRARIELWTASRSTVTQAGLATVAGEGYSDRVGRAVLIEGSFPRIAAASAGLAHVSP